MQDRSRKAGWLGATAATSTLALAAAAQAATFAVNDTTDAIDASPGDGVCATRFESCTLRAAVMEANALPGHDRIEMAPGVYHLTLSDPSDGGEHAGDLDLHESVDLVGGAVNQVIVDADEQSRVFEIHEGVELVSMEGFTIQDGNAYAEPEHAEGPLHDAEGGGILAWAEELRLDGMLVTRNAAFDGGGINHFKRLEVRHSRIHQNTAHDGGGISTRGPESDLLFSESVLWGNQAVHVGEYGAPRGGGLFSFNGNVRIERSSVVYNTSAADGGGLYLDETGGEYSLENVTISHNQVGRSGGGLYGWPTFQAHHVTITENHAQKAGGGLYQFGFNHGDFGQHAYFTASILSGNTAAQAPDCAGDVASEGYNLFDVESKCAVSTTATDLPRGLDPELGALQFQHTHFHPILWTSPALDAAGLDCPAVDQRGAARPHGLGCDVGAYESEKDPDAPIAFDDDYDFNLPILGPVTILPPGVLANDVDPNGATLTAAFVGMDPTQGAVTLEPNGGFTLVAGSFVQATKTFTYRASNGALESNVATVSVTSGHPREPEVLFEVPELPWLDPGPYHLECLGLWADGTFAAQTFGAGEWAPTSVARDGGKASSRGRSAAQPFEAALTTPDGRRALLSGSWDESGIVATVTMADGSRFAIEGTANAECNAVAGPREARR